MTNPLPEGRPPQVPAARPAKPWVPALGALGVFVALRLVLPAVGAARVSGAGATRLHSDSSAETVTLLQRSCDGHDLGACVNLAAQYMEGAGVPQDYEEAFRLDTEACDGGQASGCRALGVLYSQGHGVSRDDAQAHDLFQHACDLGDRRSCELAEAHPR